MHQGTSCYQLQAYRTSSNACSLTHIDVKTVLESETQREALQTRAGGLQAVSTHIQTCLAALYQHAKPVHVDVKLPCCSFALHCKLAAQCMWRSGYLAVVV